VPEISFPVEVVEGVPVVTAPEEIDIANAGGLKVALHEAAGPGRGLVVVDMSRARFCDSTGLNALVSAARQARAEGGEVRLVVVGDAVARIVALTGVDRVIPIYASLEKALSPSTVLGSGPVTCPAVRRQGPARRPAGCPRVCSRPAVRWSQPDA
jgi:anti-sigma B factor antagonist